MYKFERPLGHMPSVWNGKCTTDPHPTMAAHPLEHNTSNYFVSYLLCSVPSIDSEMIVYLDSQSHLHFYVIWNTRVVL